MLITGTIQLLYLIVNRPFDKLSFLFQWIRKWWSSWVRGQHCYAAGSKPTDCRACIPANAASKAVSVLTRGAREAWSLSLDARRARQWNDICGMHIYTFDMDCLTILQQPTEVHMLIILFMETQKSKLSCELWVTCLEMAGREPGPAVRQPLAVESACMLLWLPEEALSLFSVALWCGEHFTGCSWESRVGRERTLPPSPGFLAPACQEPGRQLTFLAFFVVSLRLQCEVWKLFSSQFFLFAWQKYCTALRAHVHLALCILFYGTFPIIISQTILSSEFFSWRFFFSLIVKLVIFIVEMKSCYTVLRDDHGMKYAIKYFSREKIDILF